MKRTLLLISICSCLFISSSNSQDARIWTQEEQISRLLNLPALLNPKKITTDLPDEELLLLIASDSWGYFRDIVDKETGLPLDNVFVYPDKYTVNSYTSMTNIGLHLMCIVSAFDFNFISKEDAIKRISVILNTLKKLETWEGQYFNYYETHTLAYSNKFVSSLDNGWLAAGLIIASQSFPQEIGAECESLVNRINFSKFYNKQLGQLSLGYDLKTNKLSPYHYGLIATEPRIASYIAIAKGDVPEEHWFRLYRTLPENWDWQQQKPSGKEKKYLGFKLFEGYYKYKNIKFVPSWGGSMFEFLMPTLVLKEQELSKNALAINNENIVKAQIDYALNDSKYPVWGISPCSTPEDVNGYSEYGVKRLGVKGYDDKAVITPHASFLALAVNPQAAIQNIKNLLRFSGIYGQYGFYDSVNVETAKVSTKYLALDQAMTLIALNNYLNNGAIRNRFHQNPLIQKYEKLLEVERFF